MVDKKINEAFKSIAIASFDFTDSNPESPDSGVGSPDSGFVTIGNVPSASPILPVILETERLSKDSSLLHRGNQLSTPGKIRAAVKREYTKDWIQTAVIVVICLNGLLYIVQHTNWTTRCCMENKGANDLINKIDDWLLIFYSFELGMNFYAHYFFEFWKSKWNIFDFVVIGASWIPMDSNVAAIRLSRLLRTLRLLRIGGRVESFKVIIETLQNSLSGVWTLMFLLAGLITIYAILGVALFGEVSVWFADFLIAIWTLFVTVNGENWPEIMAPIADEYWYTSLYFGSFVVLAGMIIMNMIVAVFILQMGRVMRGKESNKRMSERSPLVLHKGKFMSNTEMERMMMKMVRRHTSRRKRDAIRKQFDKINVKGEEEFGIDELTTFMETVTKTKEEARDKAEEIMDHIDQNGDRLISIDEWEDAQSLAIFNNSLRGRTRLFIDSDVTQKLVSFLIVLNGVLYIIETGNWTPNCCVRNKEVKDIIEKIDYGFLIVFSIELSMNFFSHSLSEFWKSAWNIFDVVVIGVSWIPMHSNMTAVRLSRLVRTLRLLRVGGRVGPILIVLSTLYRSLSEIGALIGLLVGLIVIFGVLGVGLFSDYSAQFATFPNAVWTLFITLNGETWPAFAEELMDKGCWYAGPYFGVFIVVAVAICMNMIIAVFIDKSEKRRSTLTKQTTLANLARTLTNRSSSDIRRLMTDRSERSLKRSPGSLRRSPLTWAGGERYHSVRRMFHKKDGSENEEKTSTDAGRKSGDQMYADFTAEGNGSEGLWASSSESTSAEHGEALQLDEEELQIKSTNRFVGNDSGDEMPDNEVRSEVAEHEVSDDSSRVNNQDTDEVSLEKVHI